MLKNVTGECVKGYIIEFYKPLWQSILKNGKALAWFPFPVRFQAKMVILLKNIKTIRNLENIEPLANHQTIESYIYI